MTLQDCRYGLRSIRRHPGLAISTVLTLALGIGLNASVFTVLQGLLFRARVEKDPASFIHFSPEYKNAVPARETPWSISIRDYKEYAASAQSVRELAAWDTAHATLEDGESDLALLVTWNFFSVYGLEAPRMGRIFSPAECATPGSAAVVVISEELWRNRFQSDPHIVGTTMRINRAPFTIAGVLPAGFAGRIRGRGIWIPWTMQNVFFSGIDLFKTPDARWLTVEGRMKPGVTRAAAQSELAVIAGRLDRNEPGRKTTMRVNNGAFAEEPAIRANLFWIEPVIMGGLTLILLIACTNITVLQLSRAAGRAREMGIRLAIGAGRAQLVSMMLMEILMLAAIAGAIAAYIARETPAIYRYLLASDSTPIYQVKPDVAVILYLSAAVLIATLMAGLSPARESLRMNVAAPDRSAGKQRNILIASQVAMSMVLLMCAALVIRAQRTIYTANPGYEARQVLTARLQLGNGEAARAAAIMNGVREAPGVVSVASQSTTGGDPGSVTSAVRFPDQPDRAAEQAGISRVSENYFRTLDIPMLRGHAMANGGEAVVSQAFAERFLAGLDPIGRRLALEDGSVVSIAGVARDIEMERVGEKDGPHVYRWQNPAEAPGSVLIRFSGDAGDTAVRVRAAIAQVEPGIEMPRTLRSMLDELADRFSTFVRLISVFAFLALALAVLGIYGVINFAVARRVREMGIRIALGATRERIVRFILAAGARPVLWGIGIGGVVAIGAARSIAIILKNSPVPIRVRDPFAMAVIACLLLIAALAAMLCPALRAASTDPARSLREE